MSIVKDLYKSVPVKASEITPEHVYLSRRDFLKAAGLVSVTALAAACGKAGLNPEATPTTPADLNVSATSDELGDDLTPYDAITNYNNYYEFSGQKEAVAPLSKDFTTSPWQVEVTGLVNQPATFAMEDILKQFTQEERIYRLRCVEGWSMVIPWVGFSLGDLLKKVEPKAEAKFVRFVAVHRREEMPGQKIGYYPWPYQEGLRIDEAMNPLATLVTGLYGNPLPKQDGAPIRLVAPWKYGFKGIKAIVKIELVDSMPETEWSTIAPEEYGFYANVNPEVPHPRWSQASEHRIGEGGRRETLMFNGYAEQVADLYKGMDLRANY